VSSAGTGLVPHIACRNATQAVQFYHKAFGAAPEAVHLLPDGRLMHATLNIDGATLLVMDEFPEQGGKSPQALGGTPVMLALQVADCDAAFQRAVDAGCEVRMPLDDMLWGDRWGLVADPYGHQWSIATTIRQVSPDELKQAMEAMSAG
jgi:PhnB protein